MPTYRRAPIVEAVIELRLETPLPIRQAEKFRDRMKKTYPVVKDRMEFEVLFEGGKTAAVNSTITGFNMNSTDSVDVLLIQTKGFSTARLAPYEGWEALKARLIDSYEVFMKLFGRLPVAAASTRFINRVDIPDSVILGQDIDSFFRFGVQSPKGLFKSCSGFSVTADVVESETGLAAKVTCASDASPLIDHQSFLVDIDVRTIEKLPMRQDEMWAKVDELRKAKNNFFEASITDRVRDLIS
ncbi:TIGR04255 family protein [Mesorhizobium sp. M1004]|uniref:TIGR04255 family protein n=1 Tax=Mesorhizobium sp. M1004 TaxID=2957046 RepID=UPI003339438B